MKRLSVKQLLVETARIVLLDERDRPTAAPHAVARLEAAAAVRVVPGVKGWRVEVAGTTRAHSVHGKQVEAWESARALARARGADAFLHGRDGHVREHVSFAPDADEPSG